MIGARAARLKKRLERSYAVHNHIEVSRSALLHNFDFFHKTTGSNIIPVLKGNAYGHGIEEVATALKGRKVSYLAVDGYFEALKVRAISKQPVLIMGMIKPENIPKLVFSSFTFVVQDEATIQALGRLRRKVKVHLEINTGMNRYGIALPELEHYIDLLQKYRNLKLEGVMSHLADADGTDARTVNDAVRRFDNCIDRILESGLRPTMFHIGQSAGSLRITSRYANATRLGIGLYGINPYPVRHPLYKACRSLQPALRLVSTITKVNQLQKGDKVSYNYTFTAPKDMQVGVLPLGYHEGLNRALSNTGVVKIGNHFYPIVGRICMNHTVIDLGLEKVRAGDEVVVYSNHPSDPNSIDSIAAEQRLFSYSMLTDLSPDVRRYLGK